MYQTLSANSRNVRFNVRRNPGDSHVLGDYHVYGVNAETGVAVIDAHFSVDELRSLFIGWIDVADAADVDAVVYLAAEAQAQRMWRESEDAAQ